MHTNSLQMKKRRHSLLLAILRAVVSPPQTLVSLNGLSRQNLTDLLLDALLVFPCLHKVLDNIAP